jgi:hypothetical protein
MGSSLKQGRLYFAIHGFFEIAQADAHQAKTLVRTKVYFLSQGKSSLSQFLRSGWR